MMNYESFGDQNKLFAGEEKQNFLRIAVQTPAKAR